MAEKLKDVAKRAVEQHDVELFGRVVDQLRTLGLNYTQCAEYFQKHANIDQDQYESLCYECDTQGM